MEVIGPVIAAAQAAHTKWGVPASVSIAQYGLESAWGKAEPADSNNPFGIQELEGLPYVVAKSHEFRNGRMVPVEERFAKFASLEQAFDKHAELLATHRAYRYAMAQAEDPDKFALALTGVYATAPGYGSILIKLMKQNDLYRYDVK